MPRPGQEFRPVSLHMDEYVACSCSVSGQYPETLLTDHHPMTEVFPETTWGHGTVCANRTGSRQAIIARCLSGI